MFVKKNLFYELRHLISQTMAAKIKSFLNFSVNTEQVCENSLNKIFVPKYLTRPYHQHPISVQRTDDKHLHIKKEIAHWHKYRKYLTIMQGVTLCDTLKHWTDTILYILFIFSSLHTSTNHSIRSCCQITVDSKYISYFFTVSKKSFSIVVTPQHQSFVQWQIARALGMHK